jgi:hypothetical protein
MTHEEIKAKIDTQWNKRVHSKIEWLELENIIHDMMVLCRDGEIDARRALTTIDEAMGAYLRRGVVFE